MLTAIIVAAVLSTSCSANILVERKDGVTPDRFRLTEKSCSPDTACGAYSGEVEADNSNCNCRCTKINNTFSVTEERCIRHLSGCTDFTIGSQDGRIFTFAIIDSKLYPKLPAKEVSSGPPLSCKTTPLAVHFQHESGWLELNSTFISLSSHPPNNYTYIELENNNHKAVAGKLIKVSYNCTSNGTTSKCIIFKIRGFQEVELVGQDQMTEAPQSGTKFDITFFFYIAAGCIALLIIASVIAISIACTHTRKRVANNIKVQRLEDSALYFNGTGPSNDRARLPLGIDGDAVRGNDGHSRKPLYIKNPHRNNPRRSAPNSPKRTANQDGSPRRSPRPPSQTSATFVVNDDDVRTSPRLPINAIDSATPKKSVLKKARKDLEQQERSLKVARQALTSFEGQRLKEGSCSQTALNPKYQVLAGVNASIRSIAPPPRLAIEHKINNKKHSKSKKSKKEEVGSVWSIDYKQFEMEDDGRQTDERVLPLSQVNITASSVDVLPPFDTPRYSTSSTSDNEHGLREFNVDGSISLSVAEFQRQIPFTNIDDIAGPNSQGLVHMPPHDGSHNMEENSASHHLESHSLNEQSDGASDALPSQADNPATNIDDLLIGQSN